MINTQSVPLSPLGFSSCSDFPHFDVDKGMTEEDKVMAMSKRKNRINRVSYTESDFMDFTDQQERGLVFTNSRIEETIPPADKNVFDLTPDDVRQYESMRYYSSQEWGDYEPLHQSEHVRRR